MDFLILFISIINNNKIMVQVVNFLENKIDLMVTDHESLQIRWLDVYN
jgi:hypothetical protein